MTFGPETPSENVRFVVLDSETTGLDPRKDRLITIGAVSVIAGEILWMTFSTHWSRSSTTPPR